MHLAAWLRARKPLEFPSIVRPLVPLVVCPLGDDAVDAIGWYLLDVTDVGLDDLQMAFQQHLDRYRSPIMTTAERIRQEGVSEGLSQGITQGISQGMSKGQATTLLRQLQKRFGPLPDAIVARITTATQAELDRYTDRILDVDSLDALFADGIHD